MVDIDIGANLAPSSLTPENQALDLYTETKAVTLQLS